MGPWQAFSVARDIFGKDEIGWEIVSHCRGLLRAEAAPDVWRIELTAVADGAPRLDSDDLLLRLQSASCESIFKQGVCLLSHSEYGSVLYVPEYQKNLSPDEVRLFRVGSDEAVVGPKTLLRATCRTIASKARVPEDPAEFEEAWKSFIHYIRTVPAKPGQSRRLTHCYNCKHNLDSDFDATCVKCNWIVCPCGACGCNYAGY